jgi:hypothetical protein
LKKRDRKLFFAAALIFVSKITFLVGLVLLAKLALGIEASIIRAVMLFAIGISCGVFGFYLTGSSKTAWLQIPHQSLAIVGIGFFFYGGLALIEGGFNPVLFALVACGPVFAASWWYCAKHNLYKA